MTGWWKQGQADRGGVEDVADRDDDGKLGGEGHVFPTAASLNSLPGAGRHHAEFTSDYSQTGTPHTGT